MRCSACGGDRAAVARYCGGCGAHAATGARAAVGVRAAIRSARRTGAGPRPFPRRCTTLLVVTAAVLLARPTGPPADRGTGVVDAGVVVPAPSGPSVMPAVRRPVTCAPVGCQRWQIELGHGQALRHGDVVVHATPDHLSVVDVVTGTLRWQAAVDDPRGASRATGVEVAAGADLVLLLYRAGAYLQAFDLADGTPRWSVHLGADRWTGTLRDLAVLDDVLVASVAVPAEGVVVHAVDARDGRLRWQGETPHDVPVLRQVEGSGVVLAPTRRPLRGDDGLTSYDDGRIRARTDHVSEIAGAGGTITIDAWAEVVSPHDPLIVRTGRGLFALHEDLLHRPGAQ